MNAPLASDAGQRYLEVLHGFADSAFRLETRQSYAGSGEDAAFAAFAAGAAQPAPDAADLDYLATVSAARERGARWQRVHVVREPLSEYLRFELTWEYGSNAEAGEQIGLVVLDSDQPWPSGLPEDLDFWLFDDRILYELRYDPDGMWLGIDEINDPGRIGQARLWRAAALRAAGDWHGYVAAHPELKTRLPRLREAS